MRDWTTLVKLRLAKIFSLRSKLGMTKYYLPTEKTASLAMIAYRG